MGVDATLFVIAKYSDDEWIYGDATIELIRDYRLWGTLGTLPSCGNAKRIQLMRASWTMDSEGNRVTEGDNEGGYLFGDSYGPDRGFKLYNVNDLDAILALEDGRNGLILNFVRQTYDGQKFLIIWH